MVVEIDSKSGFCFGVVNAIKVAESELTLSDELYCLGDIVHNDEEVARIKTLGLKTISHSQLEEHKGKKVLIRAHGEPPETYRKAQELGIKIVDASCPVVLRLQTKVQEGSKRMNEIGGLVVIFGKNNHAEVIGLMGQANGNAILVSKIEDIEKIDFSKPIELFSQTTQSPEEYERIAGEIKLRMQKALNTESVNFKKYNSICGQVANRKRELVTFAQNNDIILFVSGLNSSNGKMLYEVCKNINSHSYFITNAFDLQPEWFNTNSKVGVCGATSTPKWLMDEVAKRAMDIGVELSKKQNG
jgi:4-hydroxy-3-methylbut-2-enyl diphosphate reductase